MTNALDLYRGAGGWSVACKRLGITDWGVDNMPEANATAEAAGHFTLAEDVWKFDPLDDDSEGSIDSPPCQTFSQAGKGGGRKNLDVVLQAISDGAYRSKAQLRQAAERFGGDERTAHVLMPLHYAAARYYGHNPYRWICWEQVPTVLPVWEACARVLQLMGYNVWTGNLQAEQYGVPQTRKRAVLIASLDREVGRPTPTHSKYYPRDKKRLDENVLPWVSMAEALGWDADFAAHARRSKQFTEGKDRPDRNGDEPAFTVLGHDGHPRGGFEFVMRSNYGTGGDPTKRGERRGDEPAPTVTSKIDRNVVVQTNNFTAVARDADGGRSKRGSIPYERPVVDPAPTLGTHTDNWKLQATNDRPHGASRSADEPAPTMAFGHERPRWTSERPSTTIVGSFKPEVVAAPGYRTTTSRQNAPNSVRVTVAEAGVLQSFPADYPWRGSKSKQYLQVGNACPPLLAEAILREATAR